MGLVALQRRYLVALGLVVVGLLAFLVSWSRSGGSNAARHVTERQMHVLETAALNRLKFPGGWVRIKRGCPAGRCYLVAAPSSTVVAQMPGLLRASAIEPPGSFRAAEPVSLLKASHWSTNSRDPLVIACKTISTRGVGGLAVCQDAGRFGPTLVNVLVGPYQPCHKITCSDPGRTKVYAWSAAYPTGH